MNIAIINSLGKEKYKKCLNSLNKTINIKNHKIFKFHEDKFRGHTLNNIIKKIGFKNDLLIVADDVSFTKGWLNNLLKYRQNADIWGASMLYPNSKKIQDNGYDLVRFKENTFLRPINRGKLIKKVNKPGWKYADCVCGCFLYIKKETFKYQKNFYPTYGMNRWDELTFILSAKMKGLKLGVINHYLYHEGTSTKNNINKNLSSTSYQIEKKLWEKFENKFINKNNVKKNIKINFSNKLLKIVNNKNSKILFYGAGIFSEFLLLSKLVTNKKICFVSSFKEEINLKIANKYKIKNFKKINVMGYNLIIITPADAADKIFKSKFKFIKNINWKGKLFKVKENKSMHKWDYSINEI